MILSIVLLVAALICVVKSADWFLKAVDLLGKHFKWPAFLVGVILVGFGTSLPELATSVSSIIQGTNNVAIANIIGSNMANILLVLGLSTFFLGTIKFKKDLINLDLPYLFCITVLFIILIFDGNLSLADGIVLLTGFVMYLVYSLSQHYITAKHSSMFQTVKMLFARKNKTEVKKDEKAKKAKDSNNIYQVVFLAIVSLIILALASRLTVESVLDIASYLGVGIEIVTFLTIALGTSLPELLVSFKALKQNKGDLVLGNIIGSSIFNILLVGGVSAVMSQQFIGVGVLFWSILGLFFATLIAILNGITKSIHAWEGAIFVMIYVALMLRIVSA